MNLTVFALIDMLFDNEDQEGSIEDFTLIKDTPFSNLIESKFPTDQLAWSMCFPDILKKVMEIRPNSVVPCWEIVSHRIAELQPSMESTLSATSSALRTLTGRTFVVEPPTEDSILQWRLYLGFACCTGVFEPIL